MYPKVGLRTSIQPFLTKSCHHHHHNQSDNLILVALIMSSWKHLNKLEFLSLSCSSFVPLCQLFLFLFCNLYIITLAEIWRIRLTSPWLDMHLCTAICTLKLYMSLLIFHPLLFFYVLHGFKLAKVTNDL